MNCKSFENVVIDLVSGRMTDAAEWERSLIHAERCGQCAARLADERALAAGLAALAAGDRDKIAPARVEEALLAAYRRQVRAAPVATKSDRRRTLHWMPSRISHWAPPWVTAVAALLLIALGLIPFVVLRDDQQQRSPVVEKKIVPLLTSPVPDKDQGNSARGSQVVVGNLASHSKSFKADKKHQAPRSHGARGINEVILIPDSMTVYATDSSETNEIATDFLLLSSASSAAPIERRRLVRVEVPRSTLVLFGLPMNAERADIPVKADLLVGEDGVMQGIRFVR